MEQKRLKELEEQCIQDCPPPCVTLCPLHVDVRQLSAFAARYEFDSGLALLRKAVPFPEIIARTCDQPCKSDCYRNSKGGAIEAAAIERACLELGTITPGKKPFLPKKSAKVAVIGGGLSGLTAAYDLARKGYQVSLFEKEHRLGGSLWGFSEEILPREILERETRLVLEAGVEVHLTEAVSIETLEADQFDAFYLGTGKGATAEIHVDAQTFQTDRPDVFAGGSLLYADTSTVRSISEGRRAAISIDRFLQKVSLTAARSNEGAYTSCLQTDISMVESASVNFEAARRNISADEAAEEGSRCLQCECMECVKVCEYLRHYGSYPKKYIREIYNNLSIIMRVRSGNKFINSCTLCGLCGEVCPTDLDMGTVIREVRREMVKTGKMPVSAHDFAMRDMDFSNSEKSAALILPAGKKECTHLLFPGCQLSASNPEYIPLIYNDLASVLPSLGILLRCCGAPADWSGEEESFNRTIKELEGLWESAGKPVFVTACSSCFQVIKQNLPEARLVSIWEIFSEHGLHQEKIETGRPYVVHDPCTSRHERSWQDGARAALDAMGVIYHELPMSRNLTECCGYGGAAWLANPELTRDIIRRRVMEDESDYLTYCVMCRDLFAKEGKPTLHLLDLVYGNDLEKLAVRTGPDYSQRHENRMRVRQQMVKTLAGKDNTIVENYEKIQIVLDPEMRSRIESRLILVEDIRKVIDHALSSGESFVNQETGHSLAFFKPNLITYWVEYSQSVDGYEIHDAYSHRMELNREGGK